MSHFTLKCMRLFQTFLPKSFPNYYHGFWYFFKSKAFALKFQHFQETESRTRWSETLFWQHNTIPCLSDSHFYDARSLGKETLLSISSALLISLLVLLSFWPLVLSLQVAWPLFWSTMHIKIINAQDSKEIFKCNWLVKY